MNFSDHDIEAGRARLARLLPRVIEALPKHRAENKMAIAARSLVGQNLFDRLEIEKLEALVVHGSGQRWYADILLDGMPPGIANVFGTPVNAPLASREEAEKAAFALLETTVFSIDERKRSVRDMPPKDERPFDFHGLSFVVPGEVVDAIAALQQLVPEPMVASKEHLIARLDAAMRPFLLDDGAFDVDAWKRAGEEKAARAASLIAMLLAQGVFRLPERMAGEDAAASQKVG